ncbi:MAG: OmpA family protein, partial [Povalibacter sp.]
PGGASTSMIQLGGGMELHRTSAETDPNNVVTAMEAATTSAEDAENAAEKLDEERLQALLNQLKEAIDQRESLAQFKDQILLDVTPEGVRIQIIDHERRSMFPLGSAVLEPFADNILRELTTIIDKVPNRISISGHTDIRPYGRPNYSNWELSADRANAARRSLILGGLTAEKVGRVVGLASSVLLDTQAPESPINRRISIVVMNKRTEDAIAHENGTLLSVQDTTHPAADSAAAESGEPVAAMNAPQ